MSLAADLLRSLRECVAGSGQQNKSEQQSLTDQINNFQDRLTAQQRQLTTQFSQVNAVLEAYPYLLAEVTNQLDSLPGAITNSSKS